MDENVLPSPLVGCLICHQEGAVTSTQGRRILGFGSDSLILTCSHCGSVALFDWDEEQIETWRIRYRKVSRRSVYGYAAWRFSKAGWLTRDDAIELSTQVFIHRERLQQVTQGKLEWLKPKRLYPPPPLMSADEVVYLVLKPVNYCKTHAGGFLPRDNSILDSGTFYLTNAKLHLLGQHRDRSHRLSEIRDMELNVQDWLIHIGSAEDPHHYQGTHQEESLFDGEMIIAIIEALRRLTGS